MVWQMMGFEVSFFFSFSYFFKLVISLNGSTSKWVNFVNFGRRDFSALVELQASMKSFLFRNQFYFIKMSV